MKRACAFARKGDVMPASRPAPWSKIALLSLLFLGVAAASAEQAASQAGPANPPCGPDQLSGQYECVTSAPLSEGEVRVNLAYLAALSALTVWNDDRDDEAPAPTVAVRVSAL
jgi:hypothetical protein